MTASRSPIAWRPLPPQTTAEPSTPRPPTTLTTTTPRTTFRLPRTAIDLSRTPTRRALLTRGLRVSQALPRAGRLTWTLRLDRGPTLARRALTAHRATTRTARIRITAASARRALRTRRHAALVLTTTFVTNDGTRHTATRRLVMTAAGRLRLAR